MGCCFSENSQRKKYDRIGKKNNPNKNQRYENGLLIGGCQMGASSGGCGGGGCEGGGCGGGGCGGGGCGGGGCGEDVEEVGVGVVVEAEVVEKYDTDIYNKINQFSFAKLNKQMIFLHDFYENGILLVKYINLFLNFSYGMFLLQNIKQFKASWGGQLTND